MQQWCAHSGAIHSTSMKPIAINIPRCISLLSFQLSSSRNKNKMIMSLLFSKTFVAASSVSGPSSPFSHPPRPSLICLRLLLINTWIQTRKGPAMAWTPTEGSRFAIQTADHQHPHPSQLPLHPWDTRRFKLSAGWLIMCVRRARRTERTDVVSLFYVILLLTLQNQKILSLEQWT